jgi:hypothetical protein
MAISRAIIVPPHAVEQLEMQQSGLQRVSDWPRPFQLPHCGLLVSNRSPRREGFVYARRVLVTSPGWLIGVLGRDDSGQVNSTGNCDQQVDSANGARGGRALLPSSR